MIFRQPAKGQIKTVKSLCLWPRIIGTEVIWLHAVTLIYAFVFTGVGLNGLSWKLVDFREGWKTDEPI